MFSMVKKKKKGHDFNFEIANYYLNQKYLRRSYPLSNSQIII